MVKNANPQIQEEQIPNRINEKQRTPSETPGDTRSVTNLRLGVIALNKEDYYGGPDISEELKNADTSTPVQAQAGSSKSYISTKLRPLVFISMQISSATCMLKYVFALSYDIKLYN